MGNENCVNILVLKLYLYVRLKNVCGRIFYMVFLLLCGLFIL